MKFFKTLYIKFKFFYAGLFLIVVFTCSYFVPLLFTLAQLLSCVLLGLLGIDILLVFIGNHKLTGLRTLPDKFSNGDENEVGIILNNNYSIRIHCEIIDELPFQFQIRDFTRQLSIDAKTQQSISYTLTPKSRGEYHFGHLNVYVSSNLGLVSKRYKLDAHQMVPTYPAFKQLGKFELININQNYKSYGLKKVRRIGHSMEFEQIKDYVMGDDLRTVNWKATAKRNSLMVNQYTDENSQQVYSLIDKGRLMKMPFEGLSLLDYAINSSLVISSIVLKKKDKAGVLSFSNRIENTVAAQRRHTQMRLILESLYNVKTDHFETDFSRLYAHLKRQIPNRSLLLLYTNFETLDSLHRQLTYLKAIAKQHVLVVIFFKNTELHGMINNNAGTIQEVYDKVIAEKFEFDKRLIVSQLKTYGIHSILTTPKDLNIDTINTYLKIKAQGLL